jgi:glycosyltransferase involved in cell wall biosynthesis
LREGKEKRTHINNRKYEMSLIMPVYNEEGCILDVIKKWYKVLSSLEIEFIMIILNDGSYDRTMQILSRLTNEERIEIINKENSGHGPTILLGYRKAVKIANWVFQCDSDDEITPDYFPILWKKRAEFDALFGTRTRRKQNLSRGFISFCSRATVRFLFGKGVTDVNIPYRLIKSEILKYIIDQIPRNTFAPNIIISGVISKAKMKIYEIPVKHENRRTGRVSIIKWKLWECSIRSFLQTLHCRPSLKSYYES